MKALIFSKRNLKEIIRDPVSLAFGVGLPVVMMIIFYYLYRSVSDMPSIYAVNSMAPGMAVFGLSFITLFMGMLIANDSRSSFLSRLFASPMKSSDFILGYSLPMLPFALMQSVICLALGAVMGMKISVHILPAVIFLLIDALFYISLGLLFGSLFNSNQVGGISSLIVNAAAILSGTWIPLDAVKGGFKTVCDILPFSHSLSLVKDALAGDYGNTVIDFVWVAISTLIIAFAASAVFKKKRCK